MYMFHVQLVAQGSWSTCWSLEIQAKIYTLTNQQEIILGGNISSSLSTKAKKWLFAKSTSRDSFTKVFKKCNEVDLWLFNEALPQCAA